jgi:hypothetical protein
VAELLFGGDPIERSIAAAALGRNDAPASIDMRRAWLLDVLVHDRYPAVRQIARRGLIALSHDNAAVAKQLDAFNPTEIRSEERQAAVEAIAAALHQPSLAPLSRATIDALRSQARTRDIEIGE